MNASQFTRLLLFLHRRVVAALYSDMDSHVWAKEMPLVEVMTAPVHSASFLQIFPCITMMDIYAPAPYRPSDLYGTFR